MSRYGLVAIAHPWWRDRSDHLLAGNDVFDLLRPSRIFDQNFGLGICDDDLAPLSLFPGCYLRPRQLNRQTSGLSEMKCDDGKFRVNLDVNQFSPDELSVKTVDNAVVVHGKHEEKSDEHGFISREFTRRYVLPEGVEAEKITSSLSRDGLLLIEAPHKAIEAPKPTERLVPIVQKEETPAVAEK